MVFKTIKDDQSALFTGKTHSNPISIENLSPPVANPGLTQPGSQLLNSFV